MVLRKICKYYQDLKCLFTDTHCYLSCDQMKYYEEDDSNEGRDFRNPEKKPLFPYKKSHHSNANR